jgi:hypothetical protein
MQHIFENKIFHLVNRRETNQFEQAVLTLPTLHWMLVVNTKFLFLRVAIRPEVVKVVTEAESEGFVGLFLGSYFEESYPLVPETMHPKLK